MVYHVDIFGIRRDNSNRAALESTPNFENRTCYPRRTCDVTQEFGSDLQCYGRSLVA